MEQLLPIIVGLLVVWKLLKGAVKLIGLLIVVAVVAALYLGFGA